MTDTGPAIVIPPRPTQPTVEGVRGWFPSWPDTRGWVIAGFFGLEFYILYLVKEDGTLLANAAFMQMVTTLTTGGVLLIANFLFGGTKNSSEMSTRVGEALTAMAKNPPTGTGS